MKDIVEPELISGLGYSQFCDLIECPRHNSEIDCFSIDTNTLPNFNIYLFDGSHEESSHVKALSHFLPVLDDIFIFIVDDWNHFDVRNGTRKSIKQNNLTVLFEKEIRLTTDESHTPQPEASETWWNGIYVSILKKNH